MIKLLSKAACSFALLLLPLFSFSQLKMKNNYGGVLSVGGRSVLSTFNDGEWGNMGTGAGGQFMLQFSDQVNTAWFFDYITTGVGNFANRTDYHIGWSVNYYFVPFNSIKITKMQP